MKRFIVALIVSMGVLSGSAYAASTGSLSNVGVGAAGYSVPIAMTGTVNYDCGGQSYCGWFPEVYTVDAGFPCSTVGNLKYVGGLTQQPSATFSVSFSDYSASAGAQKACLFISHGGLDELVGEVVYNVPGSPAPGAPFVPAPAPVPAPVATPAPISTPSSGATTFMTLTSAQSFVRRIIRRQTSRTPQNLKYGCVRRTSSTFRCESSWYDRRNIYAGTLTMNDQGDSIGYSFRGLRASRSCMKHGSARTCARRVRW
jgi:hypothetical protein